MKLIEVEESATEPLNKPYLYSDGLHLDSDFCLPNQSVALTLVSEECLNCNCNEAGINFSDYGNQPKMPILHELYGVDSRYNIRV
jgi:hypothetical protein